MTIIWESLDGPSGGIKVDRRRIDKVKLPDVITACVQSEDEIKNS